MPSPSLSLPAWLLLCSTSFCGLFVVYLVRLNRLLNGVPTEVRQARGSPWTPEELKRMYKQLETKPIDYSSKIPPRLDRRYIVTGGNGKIL